ncbi:uncharacterized protein DS421_14g448490 [Arachis hypogaea]|nr:uncharacterized protein DS421_14g448490 [Arachis hypogaea]
MTTERIEWDGGTRTTVKSRLEQPIKCWKTGQNTRKIFGPRYGNGKARKRQRHSHGR